MSSVLRALAALLLSAPWLGCMYEYGHEIQWDARNQIWSAESSQVKVRSAQSRAFDTTDRRRVLEATIAAFQDMGFQITVLDEDLGIVSGRKYLDLARPAHIDLSYLLYQPEELLVFNKAYRTWGPFWNRSDLVRLTATVRRRNQGQLIVRASAQFQLTPLEDPEPYQEFFGTLERALFLEREDTARLP